MSQHGARMTIPEFEEMVTRIEKINNMEPKTSLNIVLTTSEARQLLKEIEGLKNIIDRAQIQLDKYEAMI